MEPRDYLAAVCRRWVWVTAAGLVGAVVAVALASVATVGYTARSSVFVGVSTADTAVGLANSSLVGEDVVPSIVALATSSAVVGPVAGELGADVGPAELAATLDVTASRDASLVSISATAPTARQAALVAGGVATRLEEVAERLYAGAEEGPVLRLTVVGPAQEPRFPSSPAIRRSALTGLAGGLALGVLAVGAARLVRPRVLDEQDVVTVTGATPLASLADGRPGRRAARSRATDLDRLRWLLASGAPAQAGGRLVLVGTSRRGAGVLARELGGSTTTPAGAGPEVLPVPRAELLPAAGIGPADRVVLVADTGLTSHRGLARALRATATVPGSFLGVVVDRVAVPRAGWAAWLVAAVRGRAQWGSSIRSGPAAGTTDPSSSSRAVALVALFGLGLAYPLAAPVTTGLVAAVALLPVWAGALPRFRGAALVCVLSAVGVACGLVLARRSSVDHEISTYLMTETIATIVMCVGIIGVVLWSRTILTLPWIGLAYGAGRLVTGLLRAPGSDNAVKFELALPIAIIVLALVSGRRHVLAALAALTALGLMNITNDGRSAFGFCVVAAGLVLWQARPPATSGRTNRLAGAVLLGAVAVGAYQAIRELLLAGALGAEVQARTAAQIAQSGSLLIGGRPEWTATWALMRADFWGFGLGTVPTAQDVLVAKAGIAVTNIPTVEGYLENYLMGDRVELHSIVADLWSNLGPVGLVLGIVILVLLVRGLVEQVSRREASPLVCFLVPTSAWFLAFGPLPSNLPEVAFTLGLVLAARRPASTAAHERPVRDDADREPGALLAHRV